jgi:hypothetical protein
MAWNNEPDHPFAGIAEKLKRAHQNIDDLNSEINLFIQSGKYPVLPNPNSEEWKVAVTYHKTKPIPLRFAVLAGEIIHHLRSCLDHVMWHFSDNCSRASDPNGIEFPIFEQKPRNSDELKRYKRKVQGIGNAKVLDLIEASQPYHAGADAADHLLMIVHNMDRFDKHRELMIVASTANAIIPPSLTELQDKVRLYEAGKLPESERATLIQAAQNYGAVSPGLAFRQFGKREPHSLLRGLVELWTEVDNRVDAFAIEA